MMVLKEQLHSTNFSSFSRSFLKMIISVVDGPSPTLNERKTKEQKQTKKQEK